jgi:hypothetical protein
MAATDGQTDRPTDRPEMRHRHRASGQSVLGVSGGWLPDRFDGSWRKLREASAAAAAVQLDLTSVSYCYRRDGLAPRASLPAAGCVRK